MTVGAQRAEVGNVCNYVNFVKYRASMHSSSARLRSLKKSVVHIFHK